MKLVLRTATALAAPAGRRSRLSVFYFHRVPSEPDPLLPSEPDARMFDRMLGWIGSQFRVLDPLEASDRLFDGSLPARPAVISFDDGYRDNHSVALPILEKHRMRAVFFVATGFLDGGMMFNDRVIEAVRRCREDAIAIPGREERLPLRTNAERISAIERILKEIKHLPPTERLDRVERLEHAAGTAGLPGMMMRPDEVAALRRAGMQVGGHTRTHPILLKLGDAQAWQEIDGGLEELRAITGERPSLFAYPNGRLGQDFDARHVAMVERAGCKYAFTTHPGAAGRQSGRFELPRFTPWDRSAAKFQIRSLLNVVGAC
jgi:peptidoglycan/xylan/chitin deacetylase (PgdA/CDA1 family)